MLPTEKWIDGKLQEHDRFISPIISWEPTNHMQTVRTAAYVHKQRKSSAITGYENLDQIMPRQPAGAITLSPSRAISDNMNRPPEQIFFPNLFGRPLKFLPKKTDCNLKTSPALYNLILAALSDASCSSSGTLHLCLKNSWADDWIIMHDKHTIAKIFLQIDWIVRSDMCNDGYGPSEG